MTWSDIPLNPPPKVLRQFAAASAVCLLASGVHQGMSAGHARLGLILTTLALVVAGLGWLRPAALRWPFVGWIILVFPISWAVSQLMLLVMYFGLLLPVALWFRLRGRDVLARRRPPEKKTYWQPKETPADPKRYFRPY